LTSCCRNSSTLTGFKPGDAVYARASREFFDQLPAALAYLEAGRARGKVVLKVR